MGNRRFAQLSTSDEEDETPPKASSLSTKTKPVNNSERERKRKKIELQEEEEVVVTRRRGRPRKKVREEKSEEEVEVEEVPQEDAKPAGVSTRVSGKGRGRRTHFDAFDFDGNRYELMLSEHGNVAGMEDPVLLVPEDKEQKPYVAIIKDISQTKHGSMMVTGQWFYRPEEAERKGGGGWQSRDTRELFYSFHRDEVPAESVMHKCVVHFVPTHKQLPNRKQYPGFIVQKVYDTVERKLWKLTEKDYEYNKQHGIDLLVQKTLSRMRDLPDIEIEDAPTGPPEQEDSAKAKRTLRRKNVSPLEVTREEQTTGRPDNLKAETPGSCPSIDSEYYAILLKGGSDGVDHKKVQKSQGDASGSKENSAEVGKSFPWLDAAVPAVSALEKASHDALSSDFQKYNQKLRQLAFNLKYENKGAMELSSVFIKDVSHFERLVWRMVRIHTLETFAVEQDEFSKLMNNAFLARRLLNRELEPSKMLNMSPNELKEGLTAEETAKEGA
ncbi:hypothetical protein OIU76_004011 [Salix suchowensis]|nr:hypothetical protein OIU76_004011 [Salix suchowensis]